MPTTNKGIKIFPRGASVKNTSIAKTDTDKTPDGGYNYKHRIRFPKADDLFAVYERVREKRGTMKSWENLVKQYERFPYIDDAGNVKSNFGQLRYKVDQALTTFVDFATERPQWARIYTFEGDSDSKSKLWGEEISAAFQRFCITPWERKGYEVMIAAKDMLMFNNGAFEWSDDGIPYPESIPTETLWPESSASQFPSEWGIVFIEKTYTAEKLFAKVEDEETAKANGWNRDSVLRILGSSNAIFKDKTIESVFNEFRLGNLAADVMDNEISVVIALVREYHEEGKNKISKFAFVTGSGGKKSSRKDDEAMEYILERRYFAKSVGEVVGIINQSPARKYYEATSFAQLIYTTSKNYDIQMNRILDAVEDNMRVFLRTDSWESLRKIQKMRIGMFQALDPDLAIVQDRIQRPIQDAANVLRMVMIDQNVGTGQYQVGQSNQTGGAKTATQSEIDLSESTKISSAHLKLFNMFFSFILREVYCKFISQTESDEYYERFKRFKNYLKRKNVPDSAWKKESIMLESIISLGAGSPAAKIQGGRIILEAMSSPARTPGELRAKRDIVSAIVGVENVEAYLPEDQDMVIAEDSLIGLENDALSKPDLNPRNVPVSAEHLHMRHIPRHIEDMERTLSIVEQIFQNMGQLNPDDAGVLLHSITDQLIGIDNIGGHTAAHIELVNQSASKQVKAQLQQMVIRLNNVNKGQDKMENIIGEVQKKRLNEARQNNGQDPEFNHKQRMYALEEEHAANLSALKYNDATMKGDQLRNQSAQNSQHKNRLQEENAKTKANLERTKVISDIASSRLKDTLNGDNGNGK
jgi:hypothetical protein